MHTLCAHVVHTIKAPGGLNSVHNVCDYVQHVVTTCAQQHHHDDDVDHDVVVNMCALRAHMLFARNALV